METPNNSWGFPHYSVIFFTPIFFLNKKPHVYRQLAKTNIVAYVLQIIFQTILIFKSWFQLRNWGILTLFPFSLIVGRQKEERAENLGGGACAEMRGLYRIFTVAIAVVLGSLALTATVWAFTTQDGQLDPDWTPWPANTTAAPVVEFEARIGNQATNGDWELGHKFAGDYGQGDTSGQFAWVTDANYDFTLVHDSANATFTLSITGGPTTTWDSGKPGQAVKEIWLLAKSSLDYGNAKVKSMTLDNGSGPIDLEWGPTGKTTTLSATNNKKYLLIDGEQFDNFTLAGQINFTWTSGSPSGSQLEIMMSVVYDTDGDGIVDGADNCPTVSNPDQFDCNNNGIGDLCDAVNPGAVEICDNVDNNCNGYTDENLTQPTSCGVGECGSTGIETCTAGFWGGDTCVAGTPSAETCDNLDNNCDGQIDENLTQATSCGVGECGSTGIETCTAGVWGGDTCVAGTPSAETCDNADNDCDGSVDENLTQATSCGVGACEGNTGVETCTAGAWGGDTCDPFAGATAETCDYSDNNCDGQIDEGVKTTFYFDLDNDSFGTSDVFTDDCSVPTGYVLNDIDCNDNDGSIHPGAAEICGDGIDQDCIGGDEVCNGSVKLDINNNVYGTIQVAYDAILGGGSSGDVIRMQALEFGESLRLDDDVIAILVGGYDEFFTEPSQGWTIIASSGTTLTISNGTVVVEYIILR